MLYQRGYGNFQKFQGSRYQRGHGWGSFLGRVYKLIKPALISAGKYMGRQAIDTGIGIGRDFLDGQKIGESLKSRTKQKGTEIMNKFEEKVTQAGMGKKRCKGKGKKKCKKSSLKLKSNKRSRKSAKLNKKKKRSHRTKNSSLKKSYIQNLLAAYQ